MDLNFDVTSDYRRPYSTTDPNFPVLPLLATYPGITSHVKSLTLGYTDTDWMNGADIQSWTRIPLNEYEELQELAVCSIILRQEWDSATDFFFQGVASLLSKAPQSLKTVHITVIAEAHEDECGLKHIRPAHWEGICTATPPQIEDMSITLAVDRANEQPQQHGARHAHIIHRAFAGNGKVAPAIKLLSKAEWLRAHSTRQIRRRRGTVRT